MTTYSKICPKCSAQTDLSAASCKRCGQRFGAPVEQSGGSRGNSVSVSPRVLITLAVAGVLILVMIVQFTLAAQERAKKTKELESMSYENVMKRQNGEK